MIRKTHQTIDAVTRQIRALRVQHGDLRADGAVERDRRVSERRWHLAEELREAYNALLQLLHPFAPHITEELWEMFGEQGLILTSNWPEADPALMARRT